MLPSLIAFCLLLHSSSPELARQAAVFRQNQLADAVLANDRPAMLTAIDAHANLNSPIVLTAERLTALARASARLEHYFREESKATPLILAAALGEKELCTVLVERGAERFRASAWGWVPAQYAAKCGFPELASTLIESDPLATHFNIKIELPADGDPIQGWFGADKGKDLHRKAWVRYSTRALSRHRQGA